MPDDGASKKKGFWFFRREDITGTKNTNIDAFKPANDPLKAFYEAQVANAERIIVWYQEGRRRKKGTANAARTLAFASFGVAAVFAALQTMGEAIHIPINLGLNSGQVGFLCAGFGGGMLTLDNFYGLSSGWVRYMLAELDVQQALDDFRMDWAIASNAAIVASASTPSNGNATSNVDRLQLLKVFVNKLNNIVQGETKQWAAEFQQSVAIIQTWAKNPQSINQLGTISLTVKRAKDVDAKISVSIDGQPGRDEQGETVILSDVTPGSHKITVKGTKLGSPVENSVAVAASANTIASSTVTLGTPA